VKLRLGSLLALALALCGLPDPASSQPVAPASLSLEEAIELARRHSPALQASRNDQQVADWDVRAAWGALLPSASVSGGLQWQGSGEQRIGSLTLGELGASQQPSYLFSSYGASVNLSLSGSSLLAPRQRRAEQEATAARIRNDEASLVLQVTRQYLESLLTEEGLRLAARELERAEFNLRLAEARAQLGAATALDARQAEVSLGRARIAQIQAQGALRNSRIRLLATLGVEPAGELELTSTFTLDFPGWDEDELLALALRGNPTLSALRATSTSADVGVRSARSAFYPSISLAAGLNGFTRQATNSEILVENARSSSERSYQSCLNQNLLLSRLSPPLPPANCSALVFTEERARLVRDANTAFPFDFTRQPPSMSFGISLPVFQGLSRQRNLEQARVARDDSRLRLRQEEIRVRSEASIGLTAVETALAAALLEESNALLAEEQLRLAQEQYRVGSASFVQLLESEALKARADRERLNAVFTFHDALAALEALVGTSLRTR
jgi:outer membrane protein